MNNNLFSFIRYAREKAQHGGIQRYSRNLGWMFAARIASMGISFLAIAYMARNLGPTSYGELSYAISYTSLFAFLASLGIEQVLYRELLAHPERRNVIMGTAIGLRAFAGALTAIVSVSLALALSADTLSPILIAILSTSFFFSTFQLLGQEFQADVRAKLPSLLSILVTVILNALKIFVIMRGEGVIYLAFVLALEPILYMLGYVILRHRHYGPLTSFTFDRTVAWSLLRDALPLTFVAAFAMIYARIDQVFLRHLIDVTAVGYYDAAVRLSEVWYFVPNIIAAGLFPAIMNGRKESTALYAARTRKLFMFILLATVVIACMTALLSPLLVQIVFGPEFVEAGPVLRIYVWSNIGIGVGLVTQYILIAERMNVYIAISAALGMIVNIGLCILLIPVWGMEGAALGSVVAYLVPFVALLGFRPTRTLLRTMLSSR